MNTIEMNNIKDGQSYYESVKSEIMNYASWNQLRTLELIDDGIKSCVLKCFSEDYGYAILKKRKNVSIIEDEYNTLVEYNGRCFCKIFDGDIKNGIILEEQVLPGTELRKVESLDKRLSIFCSLHKELHIKP